MVADTMDRIITNVKFPQYRIGQDPTEYYGSVEKTAEELARTGATHIMVNLAVCSIPWTMDPDNSYLRFTEYGYPMNQFVSTTYDQDIYYSKMMQLNRDNLLANAALARKYGLRCYMMCVEPTFMQEKLFARYPHWRGPRVDNPSCSHKPLFAPCVILPEVQDYYRQQVQAMLKLVPEIDEIHIFTNDTGSGFCYSSHLYAGSNGPVHCKAISPGKHAQEFCRVLLEAGRELNPAFRVIMTSGLSPTEKKEFIDGAPEGISSSIYGAFAWGGGLEDYWGNMAVGPKVFNCPEERKKIRGWAWADMVARVAPLKANNTPVYASYDPLYYRSDDPRPFETYRITCGLLKMGVTNIIGGAPGGKYSINGAVMRRAMTNAEEDVEQVIREIASSWAGKTHASQLVEAWRLCDRASCEQPMLAAGGHAFLLQPLVKHHPLVPDDDQLADDDLDYFMTPVLRDEQAMPDHQGGVWRILNYSQEDILAYIRQYQTSTLPDYRAALESIEKCLADDGLTLDARQCLQAQRRIIGQQINGHTFILTWLQAAVHKLTHLTVPDEFPSFADIIDLQIKLAGDSDTPRIMLMKKHRNDPFRKVDLTRFPVHFHQGTAGWQGAHEEQMS